LVPALLDAEVKAALRQGRCSRYDELLLRLVAGVLGDIHDAEAKAFDADAANDVLLSLCPTVTPECVILLGKYVPLHLTV
jgi:hypothetical protein